MKKAWLMTRGIFRTLGYALFSAKEVGTSEHENSHWFKVIGLTVALQGTMALYKVVSEGQKYVL